ncbi:MAG: linear amide C-N hydrolase, partial [Actinobacteria bacterium]|nr:linear amide C-N hydrolase [Actinomycetota bacterium]
DYPGSASGQPTGKKWTATYGVVGMCAFGKAQWLTDGMNTEGVSAHFLYMQNYCTYQEPKDDDTDVSEIDLIAYLLGTCKSLDEVKAAMADINVYGFDPGMGFAPPAHLLMHDAEGSLAIEFHPEGHVVVDNPVGVGTNPPYLPWHLTNLNNYIGMTAAVPGPEMVEGIKLTAVGQGAGYRGIPGDWTPPARFVRAFTMVASSYQAQDGNDAEMATLHILNNFDIPAGLIQEAGPDGKPVDEITDYLTISNLTGKRYVYRTHGDSTVRVVDLSSTDFSSTRVIPIDTTEFGGFTPTTI